MTHQQCITTYAHRHPCSSPLCALLPSPHLLLVQTDRNGPAWQQTPALRTASMMIARFLLHEIQTGSLSIRDVQLYPLTFCHTPLDLSCHFTLKYYPWMPSGCGENL